MTTMTLSEASKELRDASAQALGLPNRRWYASLADAIDAHLAKSAQVPDDTIDAITKAMRRAWSLGQTYWQQADSESYSQNKKADETYAKFDQLLTDTKAMLSQCGEVEG